MNDLVSVIVPMYNVDNYIGDCIEHLIRQTYKNIEIILVNDGSTDKSGDICRKYAELDSRIKYIEQENKGGGAARNTGLEMAAGKYITFCDSDDYILFGGIETLLNYRNEARLIIGGIEKIKHKKLVLYSPFPEVNRGKKQLAKSLINQMYFINPPINKLYQNSIIQKHHIRFNDFKYGEDTCFVYEYLKYVDSICFIPDIIYHVNVVPGSMSLRKVKDSWKYMKHIYELGMELIPPEDERDRYCLLLRAIKTSLLLELRNGKESFYKCMDSINKYIDDTRIKFTDEYDIYNKIIYGLLRKERRLLLHTVVKARAYFL